MTVEPQYTEYEEKTDNSLDITPVEKHNWKTGNSRDFWEDIHDFGEILHKVKYRALLEDDHPRKVVKIEMENQSLDEWINSVAEDDVKFKRIQEGKLLIAREGDLLEEVLDLIDETDEESVERMNELRGTPECCIEAASERREKGLEDPIYEAACASPSAELKDDDPEHVVVKDPDPMLNTFWAYRGWKFIDHMPCSFECEASGEIAAKNGEIMRELGYGDEAEKMYGFLSQPAWWSGYHGLAHIKNGYCIGSYTTDDRWSEKQVTWVEEHEAQRL